MKITTKNPPTKAIIITSLVILLIGILGYSYASYTNNWWPFSQLNEDTPSENNKKNIDLLPPTDEQVDEGYSNKDDSKQNQSTPSQQDDNKQGSSTKQNVTVTITNYRKTGTSVSVGAIVNTQTTGECTATLQKAGQVISSINGSVISQSSYLSCVDLNLPAENISGSYTLIVRFSNETQEGSMSQDVNL